MFRLSKVKAVRREINEAEQIYRLCYTDAAVSGQGGKDRILLEAGSSYRRISSLSASDQRKAEGGRVYPGRPWSIWRGGIGKVIIAMEGIIQTGEICGVPSDEVLEEMLMLKNEYRKVDCMLERELKAITLARILEVDKKRDFSQ